MSNNCAICPRPDSQLCSGCKDIRYCCRSHQKDDWPTHKLICKKFTLRHKLPHPGKVWVLYFPVDRREPEFRLLPLGYCSPLWKDTELGHNKCFRVNDCLSTCVNPYDTYDSCSTRDSVHDARCQYILIEAPELADRLHQRGQESLEVNSCIQTLTGDASWKGPVIAFAKLTDRWQSTDMRTASFNKILGVFRSVTGVRINCDGLVKVHNAPRFEPMTIKSYDLRYNSSHLFKEDPLDSENVSSLTLYTGLALQARPEFTWPNLGHFQGDERNSVSRLLSIPCKTTTLNFGYYGRPSSTGNVIVMREDRKPLDVEYLEILCDWISTDLRPLFKQARTECSRVRHETFRGAIRTRQQRSIRERVTRVITKQNLIAYSRGRLTDEDAEDTEDEEMADIIENEDTTDDDMPEDGKEIDDSDDDDDMFDDESSDIQGGDDAE